MFLKTYKEAEKELRFLIILPRTANGSPDAAKRARPLGAASIAQADRFEHIPKKQHGAWHPDAQRKQNGDDQRKKEQK